MTKIVILTTIITVITFPLLATEYTKIKFPKKLEIDDFYKNNTTEEIFSAIGTLFSLVSDKRDMIESIKFLINSDAAAEYAIDKWFELILRKPVLFKQAYHALDLKEKNYIDGIWEIASSDMLIKLQNEFSSICSFFSNISLTDDFSYEKNKAVAYAIDFLKNKDIKFGNVLSNIGIKSKNCDGKPLDVVFIAFSGNHKYSYVDITIEYKNQNFGQIIEFSTLNKFCPQAMIEMKREWHADSGCE